MTKICCVKGCKSESYPGCGISMFRFPNNVAVLQKWDEVVPFKHIMKTYYICSLHFKTEDIITFSKICRLKPEAVPSIFPTEFAPEKIINILNTIIIKPSEVNAQPSTSTSHTSMVPLFGEHHPSYNIIEGKENVCTTSMEPPPKKARKDNIDALREDKQKLQYKMKLLSQRLKRREKVIVNLKNTLDLIKKKCNNYDEVENVLVNNFMNIHKHFNNKKSDKTIRYSDELKSFSLTLYFYSAKAYLFLRNYVSLPHPSTLRRLLSTRNCGTGFMSEVLESLRISAEKNDFLRNVSLVFDSMSIRSVLTYDKKTDKYWGYVDYGGIINDDSESLATEALVFMIVSYKDKFKCPIGYFFVNKISANIQAQLILTAIRLLENINITVRSLTCDGTISNIKTYEILGCNFTNNNLKTNFKHPTKDCNIYCLLDPPHMIKLARNVFAECSITSEKGNIDFNYVKNLHDLQDKEGLKLKNKISSVHINFYGKKMNVKLAVQVLSNSVADALDFLARSGQQHFIGSEATVEYIRILDRIFDIFNAKNPFGVGYKSPLRLSNKDFWLNAINDTKKYLESLQVNGDNILTHRRKTAALGLIVDGISFSNLATDLLSDQENKMHYFLPYKCSQDHLEIFFSCVRACGALNNNPSALQFRFIMRKLLFRNSVAPSENANIIADDSLQFTPVFNTKNETKISQVHDTRNEHDDDDEDDHIDDLIVQIDSIITSDFKNNILYYIAGYIANKLIKKMNCKHCIAALFREKQQTDHTYFVDICNFSSFTAFVDRGKLNYVSKFTFDVIKYCEKIFLMENNINKLKNINKKRLMILVVQHFIINRYAHFYHPVGSSFICEDSHEIVMLKNIASAFFDLRLYSHAKHQNLKIIGQRSTLRHRLHKTILFNNV